MHEIYGFCYSLSFAIVFGAFAGNILYGAMKAVPKSQIETVCLGADRASYFQAHYHAANVVYALPLIKFMGKFNQSDAFTLLLGVEDIVYQARELGVQKHCLIIRILIEAVPLSLPYLLVTYGSENYLPDSLLWLITPSAI